jgi:hypothetical protein
MGPGLFPGSIVGRDAKYRRRYAGLGPRPVTIRSTWLPCTGTRRGGNSLARPIVGRMRPAPRTIKLTALPGVTFTAGFGFKQRVEVSAEHPRLHWVGYYQNDGITKITPVNHPHKATAGVHLRTRLVVGKANRPTNGMKRRLWGAAIYYYWYRLWPMWDPLARAPQDTINRSLKYSVCRANLRWFATFPANAPQIGSLDPTLTGPGF